MWENIVDPAAVNIDLIAQQRGCHRAALDVPAGAAATPGRIPTHVTIGFVPRFPKRKIANVFLLVLIVAQRVRLAAILPNSNAPAFRNREIC